MPIVVLLLLLLLIGIGLYIGPALFILAGILDWNYSFIPLGRAFGEMFWSSSTEFLLVAVPFFVFMSEILLRAGIADKIYGAVDPWLRWLPGGLMHTNIVTAALFSTTSGSSVATAASICTVAAPNIDKRRYNEGFFLGTIAAGGTLGILIPPSVNLIIFGALAQVSVVDLYYAAIIPGFLLAAIFMVEIFVICLVFPKLRGEASRYDFREAMSNLVILMFPLGLFALVVGTIYGGVATPTEAAALGVIGALLIGAHFGKLSWSNIGRAVINTANMTAMVMLIIISAVFLNLVLVSIGFTGKFVDLILSLNANRYVVLMWIVVAYLVLGCFMETLSIMIATTVPVTAVIVALGFNDVWWGIVFVVLIECALITPPVGLNLFVVKSARPQADFLKICYGALPFVVSMMILIGLLVAVPEIALFLPQSMK
ncbi:MAG: TRAP transporter large permease [Reyranellaceae bacterium]